MKHLRNFKLNENTENLELIDEIQEVQEQLRTVVRDLESIQRRCPSYVSERIYRYILGHLEPLIDREHTWMARDTNLQDIIDELKGNDEDVQTDD